MKLALVFVAALLAAVVGKIVLAIAFPAASMMSVAGVVRVAPTSTQQIGSISLFGTTFTPGAPTGTVVGTAAAAMSPSPPLFNGSWSLSTAGGGDTTDFAISSTTGQLTTATNGLCSSPPCNYTVNIVATQNKISNSPFSQIFTITSSSAPAPALAGCQTINGGGPNNGSCFNTEIYNLDFTGATQSFVGTNGNFNASRPISAWLGACGGSQNFIIAAWQQGTPLCGDFSVVTDPIDGGTALLITYTSADKTNGTYAVNVSPGFPSLVTPISFYYEVRMRSDSVTLTNSSAGNDILSSFSGHQISWHQNSETGPEATFVEEDLWESFIGSPNGGGLSNVVEWNNPSGCYASNCGGQIANISDGQTITGVGTFNSANYYTFGMRVTNDGTSNIEYCGYLNGIELGCQLNVATVGTFDPSGPYDHNGGFGVQGPSCQNGCTPPLYAYFQWIRVYSCSNWNGDWSFDSGTDTGTSTGNPCAGALISSNP